MADQDPDSAELNYTRAEAAPNSVDFDQSMVGFSAHWVDAGRISVAYTPHVGFGPNLAETGANSVEINHMLMYRAASNDGKQSFKVPTRSDGRLGTDDARVTRNPEVSERGRCL